MTDNYMNTRQISDYIGMCYAKTLDFIKYSGIKYIKIGRTYFIEKETLDKFLHDNTDINTGIIIEGKYLL